MPDDPTSAIRTDIPHSARIWNYWLGGKDNYPVDRAAGDAGIQVDPGIKTMAMESRRFLVRSVRYMAGEGGLRQFLDIGTGLPTMQNTHEVAQSVAPESKVVYVDNDPLVLAHARALLINTTPEGVTTYVDADYHEPEQIITAARNVLNFNQPVGVMFMGVLGHARTYDEMLRIVGTMMDAVPSGSYLAMCDGTDDSPTYVELCENYARTGGDPYIPRSADEIRRVFDGLELVPPGFGPITRWHPGEPDADGAEPIAAYGGVARKP